MSNTYSILRVEDPEVGYRARLAYTRDVPLRSCKARGALMFRSAESVNVIIVHPSIRDAVEAAGINTLTFLEPEDWSD
jgi:hypothetical protein